MTYKGMIFDMDGVLFAAEDFYYQRRADFLVTRNISIDHLSPAVFVGARASQVWELILQDSYKDWDIQQLQADYNAYKATRPTPYRDCVFPDAKEVLQALKGYGLKLALASNTDRSDVERALEEAGLRPYFDLVFSATECRACKPDPEVYEQASAALGFDKSQLVVIEDSPIGIEAGLAAGLEVWAIRASLSGVDQGKAHRIVDGLTGVLETFRQTL